MSKQHQRAKHDVFMVHRRRNRQKCRWSNRRAAEWCKESVNVNIARFCFVWLFDSLNWKSAVFLFLVDRTHFSCEKNHGIHLAAIRTLSWLREFFFLIVQILRKLFNHLSVNDTFHNIVERSCRLLDEVAMTHGQTGDRKNVSHEARLLDLN